MKSFAGWFVILLLAASMVFTTAFGENAIDIESLSTEELLKLQESIANKLNETAEANDNDKNEAEASGSESAEVSSSNRSIEIIADDNVLYNGKSKKLKADVTRNTEDAPKTTKVVWSSDNPEIATVSKDGIVKGVSAGTAVITASASDDGSISSTFSVDVRMSVKDIKTEMSKVTLLLGGEEGKDKSRIDITVLPEDAYNKAVTYTSSNPDAIKVDEQGNLQALAAGKATITIKSEDDSVKPQKSIKVSVTAIQSVTEINIQDSKISIGVGKTAAIKAEALPSTASQRKIQYISTDERVAIVSQNGLVTGKSKGSCKIRCVATDGSEVESFCEIDVIQPVNEITVRGYKTGTTLNLVQGETKKLEYVIHPANATERGVHWTTSDTSVVAFNGSSTRSYCEIKAMGGGTATVVGTAKDGSNKKITVKINVEPKMSLKYVDLIGYETWGIRYFVYKFKNVSKTRTVDGLTVKYWAEDVYHNKMRSFGFGDYEEEETLNVTIKPGQTKKTERFYTSGFNDAKYIHIDLVKVHYTDGTTITNNSKEFAKYFTY